VEALQPPELFEWFVSLRTKLGMNVVPLGPNVAGEVLKALRNNEVVCLLCDRDLQGGGVVVRFLW
jgi:phosphatidylinositol dimannoside acyltransferase